MDNQRLNYVNYNNNIPEYRQIELRNITDSNKRGIYETTKEWKKRRILILEAYCNKCAICKEDKKLEIHHKTYDNYGNEKFEDLIPLCQHCHDLEESKNPCNTLSNTLAKNRNSIMNTIEKFKGKYK